MLSALPTALPSADTSTSPAREARGRDQPTADDTGFARLIQQQSQLRQAQQRQLAQRQATPQPQALAPPSAGTQGAGAESADEANVDAADEASRRPGSAADTAPPSVAEMPAWLQLQPPSDTANDAQSALDHSTPAAPATDPAAPAGQPGAAQVGAIAADAMPAPGRLPTDTLPAEVAGSGQATAKSGLAAAATAVQSASLAQRAAGVETSADRRIAGDDSDEPAAAIPGERAAVSKIRGDSALRPLAQHAEPPPTPAGTPGAAGAFERREQAASSPGRDPGGAEAIGQVANTAAPFTLSGPAGAATLPAPAAADVPAQAQIPVPLDSPLFAPALGTQISLFARDGVQSAQLQLNPAEMGPISVQIMLDGQTARVDFQADLAATRQVIEASLPALASALQDAGLTLAGGGVFQQSPGQQDAGQGAPAPPQRSGERSTAGDALAAASAPHRPMARRGLVDLVA